MRLKGTGPATTSVAMILNTIIVKAPSPMIVASATIAPRVAFTSSSLTILAGRPGYNPHSA